MRKKKYLAKISAICLMLTMLFPTTVFAAAAGDSTTKLQTTVPKTHTVRLEIGENGSVTVGKETYSGTEEIRVERLAEASYEINAEEKYEIETVTYDGTDVTDQLQERSYQAPPVNKDGLLFKVTFREKETGNSPSPADTETTGTDEAKKNPAETGDETDIAGWLLAAAVSAGILTAAAVRFRQNNRRSW